MNYNIHFEISQGVNCNKELWISYNKEIEYGVDYGW
jgi:hypothetical protein